MSDARIDLAADYCAQSGILGFVRTPWCGLATLAGVVAPSAEVAAKEAGATARVVVPEASASVASASTAAAVSAGLGTIALGLGALGVAALVGLFYVKTVGK